MACESHKKHSAVVRDSPFYWDILKVQKRRTFLSGARDVAGKKGFLCLHSYTVKLSQFPDESVP